GCRLPARADRFNNGRGEKRQRDQTPDIVVAYPLSLCDLEGIGGLSGNQFVEPPTLGAKSKHALCSASCRRLPHPACAVSSPPLLHAADLPRPAGTPVSPRARPYRRRRSAREGNRQRSGRASKVVIP